MVNRNSFIFLFIGNEKYLKKKAIEELGASLIGDSSLKELDYKVFYGGESDAREILDYSTTLPFLAEKRFVVIRDFEKLSAEDKARLIAYTEKPSRHACIVIDLKDDSLLKEYPFLNRSIEVVRFDDLTGSKLSLWIKRYISSNDKEIDPAAIESLKEIHDNSLLSLESELDKLIAYVGKKMCIDMSDVESLLGRNVIGSTFDLARAIGDKDTTRALELAYELTSAGKRVHEIIGLVSWHFRRILKAMLLQDKGKANFYIMNELGINRRDSGRFFDQLKSFDLTKIKSKMDTLLEADLDIKKSRLDPRLILEFVIIRLCLG